MREAILALQSGNMAMAIEGFTRVFQNRLLPTAMRADAFSNASVCYLRLREWKQAEGCADAALNLSSKHIDARMNRGDARMGRGAKPEGLRDYREATRLCPQRTQGWLRRATAAQTLFLWEEAADAWTVVLQRGWDERAFLGRVENMTRAGKAPLVDSETANALTLHPDAVFALYSRLIVLSDLQRYTEALPVADRLSNDPRMAEITAWVYGQGGSPEKARSLLPGIPESARKHALQLMLAAKDRVPSEVSLAKHYLASPKKDLPDDLAGLLFQLGRIYDPNQPDEAMRHYDAAHRILGRQQRLNEDGVAKLDLWLRARPWEHLPAIKTEEGPAWLFVVGMPRSGTTLLEQILDQHTGFHGCGERHAVQQAGQAFFRTGDAMAVRKSFVEIAQSARAIAPKARWVIDKMPANAVFADLISHLLPNARVIWCQRDHRDTLTSIW